MPWPRFKRNSTSIQIKNRMTMVRGRRIMPGSLIEFKYGTRKPLGETGGYHVDPTPLIFVFRDDAVHYIEGINSNYLPPQYVLKMLEVIDRYPGIRELYGGKILYTIIKTSAKKALELGYRKYKREVIQHYAVRIPRKRDESSVIL